MAADDERGFFSEHDPVEQKPLEVATAEGQEHAAIRPSRRPLACMRFEDFHFEFDSSFVKAEAAPELTLLATWHDQLKRPSLGVFGHADPVGDDEYNKTLSGRRAQAIYGLLTRRTALWDELWATPMGGDNWQNIPAARAAHAQGFAAYMDSIARDGTGAPWKVDPTEFLGGGKDPGGKADYQGCSEFNPVLRFSSADEQALSAPGRKDERNRRNASNRRVLVFLWPPGLKVDPAGWPCPRVKESSAGCKAQFWPDGDARRNPTERQREYAKDHNTFACRWYDGMARESPCEAARKLLTIRLLDAAGKEMPDARYRLTVGSVEVRNRTADGRGVITERNVLAARSVKLAWGIRPGGKDFDFENDIRLDVQSDDDDEATRRRLSNLGYGGDDIPAGLTRFKQDYGIADDTDDATTRANLADVHDNQLSKQDFQQKQQS
jgi:hypothetical protein